MGFLFVSERHHLLSFHMLRNRITQALLAFLPSQRTCIHLVGGASEGVLKGEGRGVFMWLLGSNLNNLSAQSLTEPLMHSLPSRL